MRERGETVAVAGGGFEVEPLGGCFHRPLHRAADRRAAPGQEAGGLLDQTGIILQRNLPGTGRRTAFDLKQQARPGAAFEHRVGAGAEQECAFQRVDGAADRAGGGEGAEVAALARAGAAVLGEPRGRMVAGQQDMGKRFVVPEKDVVPGSEALDEIGLQKQRLGFGAGRHELHRRRGVDDALDARWNARGTGVALDPLAQAARLADVEHGALGVDHAVDTRPAGEPLDDPGNDCGAGRHRRRRGIGIALRRFRDQSMTCWSMVFQARC